MLKSLLALLAILITTTVAAQLTITIDPNPVHGMGSASSTDIKTTATVTNTSNTDVAILWTREVVEAPAEWLSWVCDTRACYDPTFSASPEDRPNFLAPDESMSFEVHVRPNEVDGIAQLNFSLYDASDPETILAVIETTFETSTTGTSHLRPHAELRVYPNPTTSYFRIYGTNAVKKVILYNMVSNPVAEFAVSEGGQYDVSNLPQGMYFARFIASDQSVIKTVRLSKR